MRCINCFHCGNPAIEFFGHVHRYGQVLTAGWCTMCLAQQTNKISNACKYYPNGCLGRWQYKHGVSTKN